jgi:hypothetical protein
MCRVEDYGGLIKCLGTFSVLPDPSTGGWFVDLECKQPAVRSTGSIDGGFVLHLSQRHVDSILAPTAPDSGVDWVVSIPFLRRHHISNKTNRQAER